MGGGTEPVVPFPSALRDNRIQLERSTPNELTISISDVVLADEGEYTCSIFTMPVRTAKALVTVLGRTRGQSPCSPSPSGSRYLTLAVFPVCVTLCGAHPAHRFVGFASSSSSCRNPPEAPNLRPRAAHRRGEGGPAHLPLFRQQTRGKAALEEGQQGDQG